jgi:hypothetical protein
MYAAEGFPPPMIVRPKKHIGDKVRRSACRSFHTRLRPTPPLANGVMISCQHPNTLIGEPNSVLNKAKLCFKPNSEIAKTCSNDSMHCLHSENKWVKRSVRPHDPCMALFLYACSIRYGGHA